jgi:hypothetical protein
MWEVPVQMCAIAHLTLRLSGNTWPSRTLFARSWATCRANIAWHMVCATAVSRAACCMLCAQSSAAWSERAGANGGLRGSRSALYVVQSTLCAHAACHVVGQPVAGALAGRTPGHCRVLSVDRNHNKEG